MSCALRYQLRAVMMLYAVALPGCKFTWKYAGELHRGLLSFDEQENMVEHIRSWVAKVGHKCTSCDLIVGSLGRMRISLSGACR